MTVKLWENKILTISYLHLKQVDILGTSRTEFVPECYDFFFVILIQMLDLVVLFEKKATSQYFHHSSYFLYLKYNHHFSTYKLCK